MARKSRSLELVIRAKDAATRELKKIDRSLGTMRKSIGRLSKVALGAMAGLGLAATAAATAVLYAFSRIAKSGIDAASDMEEVQSKFNTVFAGMTEAAEKAADVLVDSYLMSAREAKQYLSSIQDLLVPMGMAADKAERLSFEITKLAADLGSFNNLPTEQVILDIQSALVGNYETMKKYGVVVNSSTVQQKALDMGLAHTKDELTAAQKAHAAYTLIVQSSQAAIGDITRTSEGYANQVKQLKANLEGFRIMLGEKLLPLATDFVTEINEWYKANKKVIDQKLPEHLLNVITALSGIAKTASYLPTIFAAIMNGLSKMTAGSLALIQAPVKIYEKITWLNSKLAIINRKAEKELYEDVKAFNAEIDEMGAGLIGAGENFDAIGVKTAEFGLKARKVISDVEKSFKASLGKIKSTSSEIAQVSGIPGLAKGLAKTGTDEVKKLEDLLEKLPEAQKMLANLGLRIRTDMDAPYDKELAEMDGRHATELDRFKKLLNDKLAAELGYVDSAAAIKDMEAKQSIEKDQLIADQSKRIWLAKLDNASTVAGGLSDIFQNLYEMSGEKNKEMFYAAKAAAIAEATINIAQGVTKALAQGGIFGHIMAGVVAAAGAIQIAKITAQSLAEGGMVLGESPSPTADNIDIKATAGEYVQPVSAVRYYGAQAMEAIRSRMVPREFLTNAISRTLPVSRPAHAFAGGGMVEAAGAPGSGGSEITLINFIDPREMDQYLASPSGQSAVVNVISRRAGKIRKILR